MMLTPPTSHLPPIRKVGSCTISQLSGALSYLRRIYNPEVRGSRRRRSPSHPDPRGPGGPLPLATVGPDGEGVLDDLQADAFERSYAIKWLTAVIAQTESWDSESPVDIPSSREREDLIQDAAALLAICSGTSAAGVIVRDFVFTPAIKVNIRDVPLDNQDYGSVGAQTWGGACVLAELIIENPSNFDLSPTTREGTGEIETRILELGAGTGLVSLAVAEMLVNSNSLPPTSIVATDYYPSVLFNLEHNIQTNFPSSLSPATRIAISSHPLDWSRFPNEPTSPPFDTPFDLILGADIIYEAEHALWIKSCLQKLLRKPTRDSNPLFHLVIPLRSTHSSESQTVDKVFGPQAVTRTVDSPHPLNYELQIISKESIICDAGTGIGPGHVEYAYYRIGWCPVA